MLRGERARSIPVVEWFVATYGVDAQHARELLLATSDWQKEGRLQGCVITIETPAFARICAAGHIEMLDYIERQFLAGAEGFYTTAVNQRDKTTTLIWHSFDYVCARGQVAAAKWLLARVSRDLKPHLALALMTGERSVLLRICENCHIAMLRWLMEEGFAEIMPLSSEMIAPLLSEKEADPKAYCLDEKLQDVYLHPDVVDYLLGLLSRGGGSKQVLMEHSARAYMAVLRRQLIPPAHWIAKPDVYDPEGKAVLEALKYHGAKQRGAFVRKLLVMMFLGQGAVTPGQRASTSWRNQRTEIWASVCTAGLDVMRVFACKFDITRDDVLANGGEAFAAMCANDDDADLAAAEWSRKKFGLGLEEITTAMRTLAEGYDVTPERWAALEEKFGFSRWAVLARVGRLNNS